MIFGIFGQYGFIACHKAAFGYHVYRKPVPGYDFEGATGESVPFFARHVRIVHRTCAYCGFRAFFA